MRKPRWMLASLVVMAGGVLLLSGSNAALAAQPQPDVAARAASADVPQKTRAEGRRIAEQNIAKKVRHELLMLPYYSVFDHLEYKVDGYTVVLSGQVLRPTLKSDAEGRVKKIEAVEKVVNKIEVLPLSNFDDNIRRATYRAIFGQPGMQKYAIQPVPPIHIIVKNGRVRLVGVVANKMDRNVACLRASSVPGVFSVTNELKIDGAA